MVPHNNKASSLSSGSIINKDEKRSFFTIPLDKIKLTSNPLDDYQRTLFSLVFSNADTKCEDNNNGLNIEIKKVEYKSNLAEKLADLHALIFSDNITHEPGIGANGRTKDKYNGKVEKSIKKKSKNPLHGLMYSFPDFKILSTDSKTPTNKKKKSSLKLSDRVSNKLSIGSTLYPQIFDIDITTTDTTEQHDTILIDNTLFNDGSEYSIVQNQLFKKENDLHFEHNQYHIFNRNNSVIWSPDKSCVFVTGIWKLYQDAMYGLSNIGRLNKQTGLSQQDICGIEFQTVLEDLFPNLSPRFSHNIKKGCRNSEAIGSERVRSTDNTEKPNKPLPKYVEFHWDKIHCSIRKNFWNRYRNYLIHSKQIDPEILGDIEKLPFIQKVRGGYIHIQGTWLPIELARYLCITFAFPIRYLLVPIFGSEFPKECEEWYANRQQNMAQLKSMPLNLVYNKVDCRTCAGSSASSKNTIIPNPRSRIHFIEEASFCPSKKRSKNTIKPTTSPLECQQHSLFDGQLLRSSVSSTTTPLSDINNFSNELNRDNEKARYLARKTTKSQCDSRLNKELHGPVFFEPIKPHRHNNQQLSSNNITGTAIYQPQHSPLLPSLNRDVDHVLGTGTYQNHIPGSRDVPVYIPVLQKHHSYGGNSNANCRNTPFSEPKMCPVPSLTPINPVMRPIMPQYSNNTMTHQHNTMPPPFYRMVHTNNTNTNIPQFYGGPLYASTPNFQLNNCDLQECQQTFSARGNGSWIPTRSPYPLTEQFQQQLLNEDQTLNNQSGRTLILNPSVVAYPPSSPNQIYQNGIPVFVDEQNNIIKNNNFRPGTKPNKQ